MLVEMDEISKSFFSGWTRMYALYEVTLDIERGEFVTLTGPSGCGKSTLLHIIGCLDRPTSGMYRLDGHEVQNLSRTAMAKIRGKKLGFLFQRPNLIPHMTILQNVELPLIYRGVPSYERDDMILRVLDKVGLSARMSHRPWQLSAGQQQKAALARALVGRPEILITDEPTGDLDTRAGDEIIELLVAANRSETTVVMATHDADMAELGHRTIRLVDGRIVE